MDYWSFIWRIHFNMGMLCFWWLCGQPRGWNMYYSITFSTFSWICFLLLMFKSMISHSCTVSKHFHLYLLRCKQTHPCSWRRQGVVWIHVEANGWRSPSRYSWSCPILSSSYKCCDIHDDDDMFNVSPCECQNLFSK
jgi:hypothetical protein